MSPLGNQPNLSHKPDGEQSNIEAGRPAAVQLILDGRRSNAAQIVQGYAAEIVQDLNRTISAEQNRPEPPSLIVARNWFNPNLEYHWFTVSSLIGKTVPSLIVGLFNGTIFLLIATLVFQIPFTGSILLLYASLTVYMISVIVNGLFTKDMPLGTVFENAWPLIVIALVTMTSAGWLFRRRME